MATLKTKKNELPPIRREDGDGDYVKARRKWNPTREQILAALRKSSKALKRKLAAKERR